MNSDAMDTERLAEVIMLELTMWGTCPAEITYMFDDLPSRFRLADKLRQAGYPVLASCLAGGVRLA